MACTFKQQLFCSQQSYAGPDAADASANLGNGFQFVSQTAASQEDSLTCTNQVALL